MSYQVRMAKIGKKNVGVLQKIEIPCDKKERASNKDCDVQIGKKPEEAARI